MTKKFTQSIILLIFLNLLIKPFYIFAIERNVQNLVGTHNYGIYFSLMGFSLLFNIIADFGITNYNIRYIAINPEKIDAQLGNIIPVKIAISVIYIFATLIFAIIVDYNSEQFWLLIWLIINQVIISFTLYLRSNISGIQLFNIDSMISVIDKLLLVLICGFLIWGRVVDNFTIEYFIYAQTFSYLMAFLVAIIVVYSKSDAVNFSFKLANTINILRNSIPYAVLMFLMIGYTRIDAVLIERLLPDGEIQAGIYAQSFRLIDALSMFAYLFASILLPLFARMIKDKKPINHILSHSFSLLFIPSIGLIVALFVFSEQFMHLLYNQYINESAMILRLNLFSYLGICFTYIFGTLITASGNIKLLNKISLFGLCLNILLNLILIPHFGIKGAAITSLSTQLVVGVSQMAVSMKIFGLPYNYKTTVKFIILTLIVLACSIIFKKFAVSWYFSVAIIPFLSILIGLIIQLIKISDLVIFMNKSAGSKVF